LVGKDFDFAELETALRRIRKQGHEIHRSRDVVGITDIACPILNASGEAVAALVMPFVNRVAQTTELDDVLAVVRRTAQAISSSLYGARS